MFEQKNMITKRDAIIADKANQIENIRIVRNNDVFNVLLKLKEHAGEFYLAASMNLKRPCGFRDPVRLIDMIENGFPNADMGGVTKIQIHRMMFDPVFSLNMLSKQDISRKREMERKNIRISAEDFEAVNSMRHKRCRDSLTNAARMVLVDGGARKDAAALHGCALPSVYRTVNEIWNTFSKWSAERARADGAQSAKA